MQVDESKFPFKWMSRVMDAFEGADGNKSSFQIARTIGSCSPDASEVLKMMVYITSHGKIIESNGMWKIISPPIVSDLDLAGFRTKYIQKLDQLIKSLSSSFVTIETLTSSNGRDNGEVQKELQFLSQITEKGQIIIARKKFPQKFALKPWDEQ